MHLHSGSEFEALVKLLAEVVERPVAAPTEAEVIVVESGALARWLSLELARRLGIWANPSFPFPRHFLDGLAGEVLGVEAASSVFTPGRLRWAVAAAIPRLPATPAVEPIRSYLADDSFGHKRFDLAEQIARAFDGYATFRPEWIADWEAGRDTDGDWQPILWRRLVETHGRTHFAARTEELVARLEKGEGLPESAVPKRVSWFAPRNVVPLHARCFAALARHTELHVFLHEPIDPEVHGETGDGDGNPLATSLGVRDRALGEIVRTSFGDVPAPSPARTRPADTTTDTALRSIQADIRANRRRGARAGDPPPLALDPADRSISIHACHGPMREVEVLRDHLLACFDADPTLAPHDVAILSPEIESYAPYIDAVFGVDSADPTFVPYTIADRSARAALPAADALLALLDVLRGRMPASQGLDLLRSAPIRTRFGIRADEIDTIERWVEEAGIRWATDETHRESVGQPACRQNTWGFGLDRLLVGYAIDDESEPLFQGIAPYADLEGDVTGVLGRFAAFAAALSSWRGRVGSKRTPAEWRELLEDLVESMLEAEGGVDGEREILAVRGEIGGFAEDAAAAGFDEPISLDPVVAALGQRLGSPAPRQSYLSGRLTFCGLEPVRGLPFRVIALLGLHDEGFPRSDDRPSFDRLGEQPRRVGDPSRRETDRSLFLAALLAARDRLLVTYQGADIQTDEDRPPSVVVAELLDVLGDSFTIPAEPQSDASTGPARTRSDAARRRFVVRHRMQPFSAAYFDGRRPADLFSFSASDRDAACAARGPRGGPPAFVRAPLVWVPGEPLLVSIDELVRFFRNPVADFLRRRLGLVLDETATEETADREPIRPVGLDSWAIGDRLLRLALSSLPLGDKQAAGPASIPNGRELLRAQGLLPLGTAGEVVYRELEQQALALAAKARAHLQRPALDPVAAVIDLEGVRLVGTLRDLRADARVVTTYARLGGANEVEAWIRHLALGAVGRPELPTETFLIGRPADSKDPRAALEVKFAPADGPRAQLEGLVAVYREGQERPLPLPCKSALAYALTVGEAPENALDQARKTYRSTEWTAGEDADPAFRRVFGAADPLSPDYRLPDERTPEPTFEGLVERVFAPFLAHRTEPP